MPNKGLYIPDAEVPLWDAAQRVAKKYNVSLYRVVAEALKNDLPRADVEGPVRSLDEWSGIAADAA
jgi:hypothetical protein